MMLPFFTLFMVLGVLTTAKPHSHMHRHVRKAERRDISSKVVMYEPAGTAAKVIFVLDNQVVSEEEVRQGIANGTLYLGQDGKLSTSIRLPIALPTPSLSPEHAYGSTKQFQNNPRPTPHVYKQSAHKTSTSPPPTQQLSSSISPTQSAQPVQSSSSPWADLVDENGYCASCDKEFPNNKIPCTEFPYGYGALPLSSQGLGGWSGIQDPLYRGSDGFDDIDTVTAASCDGESCCTPGSFCSYGCPNPYLKLSFPKKQGKVGQTVGGLYCNDQGFLEMADGSLGTTLCGPTSKSMTVKVQNKLFQSVSICRTDYPGDEDMTFPLTVGPGETAYLANPDQSKYFFWDGQKTSAHYYVNKQGVPESEACTWGTANQGQGNWAPAILGTSFDDVTMHTGFSSLKQNELEQAECLDYDMTFTGDGVTAPCKFNSTTGQYCQGDDCWTDKNRGCTASTQSGGTLVIVLSSG